MEEVVDKIKAMAQYEMSKDRDEKFGIGLTAGKINPVSAYVKEQRDGAIGFARDLQQLLKGIENNGTK